MTWFYQGQALLEPPEGCQGFVYEIYDNTNHRRYIGKKNFWRTQKLPPLKGRKNRRHRRVETDWQQYYGSNTELAQRVETLGADSFHRTILQLCANRTEMTYWEMKYQFERDVLFDDSYYNSYIGGRITAQGLKDV
jgi:hypothetical protein